MTRRTLRVATAAMAAAAVLLLAGCGSGGSASEPRVSPTRYVTSLCHAFRPFVSDIATREQALAAGSYRTPRAGRAALVGFLGALAGDARSAAVRASAAGVPAVAGGREIAGRLSGTFARISVSLRRAETEARGLPVGSPTEFGAAAARLKQGVSTALSGALSGMSGLATGVLDQAAQRVAACHGAG
jgi:hypothetical protein